MKSMVNQPDQDMQGAHTPASKLALSEPPNAGQYRQRYSSLRPGQSINQLISAAPHGLFTHVLKRLRTDRAFALLSLAIALVVITSLILVSLGVNALANGNSGPVWNQAMTEHPILPTPTGTFNTRPKFPTPVTGKGSSKTSQPGAGPPPNLQPTSTDTNDQGTLNVQISTIPDVVNNRSQIQVGVQTSEPDVNVRLEVTYDASPFYYTSRGDTTDNQGNATLSWSVRVRSSANGNNVQATVVVVATDQNGQQATSQPVTVEITP